MELNVSLVLDDDLVVIYGEIGEFSSLFISSEGEHVLMNTDLGSLGDGWYYTGVTVEITEEFLSWAGENALTEEEARGQGYLVLAFGFLE